MYLVKISVIWYVFLTSLLYFFSLKNMYVFFVTRIILNEAEIQVEKKYVTLKLFFSQNKIKK